MKSSELVLRTKNFAHRCIKLAVILPNTILGLHIRKQLIRCSLSVAAKYRAICLAHTKPSFISKLSIVVEESDESNFWLLFIKDEKLINQDDTELSFLINESEESTAIFVTSRKTAHKRDF